MTDNTAPSNTAPSTAVAWEPPDAGEWALEAAHGAALPAVTFQHLMSRAFAEGSKAGSEPLGLPLSHIEIAFVNGWPYVSFVLHDVPRSSGKPPPAFVLKAVTRLHPGFRRRTKIARQALAERRPQAASRAWFGERERWIERMRDLQRVEVVGLTNDELASHLRRVAQTGEEAMRRHFELIFTAIPLGRWFRRAEAWGLDPKTARSAVMHGTPVHEEARARIDRIIDQLGDERPTSLGEIRSLGNNAAAALDEYLEYHGGWGTSDSLQASTIAEHPDAVLRAIEARRQATVDSDAARTAAVNQLRQQVREVDHDEFDELVDEAHYSYRMLDDNSGILGAWGVGVVGTTLKQVARRLVTAEKLLDADHVWALDLEEIVALITAGPGEVPDRLSPSAIAATASAWRAQAELNPPRYLGGEPSPPPSVEVFPAPVAELMGGLFAFINDKFNEERVAMGIGDAPATGRAVVVDDADAALDRLEPGDILVTTATNPAYNTVLGIAGGVVVTEGGPSSHTAVVARELGIPAIVAYPNATSTIPDGSIIEIDPVAATVRVVSS